MGHRLMQRLKQIYIKYKEQILYIFFGGLTTLINLVASWLFKALGMSSELATAAAWLPSVVFAFVSNKLWVFESKSTKKGRLLYEIGTFLPSRLATGALDVGIMYLAGLIWQDETYFLLMRVLSNVIVIVLNYLAGKLITFRKKK